MRDLTHALEPYGRHGDEGRQRLLRQSSHRQHLLPDPVLRDEQPGRHRLTHQHRHVGAARARCFRREREYWTIVYEGQPLRLPDGRGLRHLALQFAHPHTEISALALEHRATEVAPPSATRIDAHDARERAWVNVILLGNPFDSEPP